MIDPNACDFQDLIVEECDDEGLDGHVVLISAAGQILYVAFDFHAADDTLYLRDEYQPLDEILRAEILADAREEWRYRRDFLRELDVLAPGDPAFGSYMRLLWN